MSRHVVLGVHLDEHKRAEKDESVPRSAPGRLVVERSFRHQSTVHGLEDPDAGDGPERAERVAWTSWAAKRPTSSASRSLRQSTGFHRAMRPGPDAARQPARLSATAALRAVQAPRALSVHTRDTVGVTSAMRSTKNRSQSSRVVSACLPLSPARVLGPSPQGRKDLSTSPTDDCDHGKGPRLSDVTASPCQEGFWRGGTLYLANETDGGRAGGGGFGKAWGMRTSCEKGQWSGRWRTSSAAESDGMRRQAERQARGSDGQERRGARSSSQEPGPGRPHVRRGAASTSKALGDMPAGESSPPKVGRQMNRGQLHAPEPQAALAPDHLGSEGVEGTRSCGEGGAVQVHFARFGKDALAPGGAARVALHGCGLLELPRELLAAPRDGGARATLQHLSLAWNTLAALPPEAHPARLAPEWRCAAPDVPGSRCRFRCFPRSEPSTSPSIALSIFLQSSHSMPLTPHRAAPRRGSSAPRAGCLASKRLTSPTIDWPASLGGLPQVTPQGASPRAFLASSGSLYSIFHTTASRLPHFLNRLDRLARARICGVDCPACTLPRRYPRSSCVCLG
jgi:hypothetical protein